MNIQEAYKKLDLARGLDQKRVDEKFNLLKNELEERIANSQNEKLKQVFINRLNDIENAYQFLTEYFIEQNNEIENQSVQQEEIKPIEPVYVPEPPIQVENKEVPRSNKLIWFGIPIGLIFLGLLFYFLKTTNLFGEDKIDIYRKMDGEVQVFVNNLILRQYPDTESSKIETFPFGTRLIFDENEPSNTDNDNRVWRKVRFIHPTYGWDKPSENSPYPFEGWIAVSECGVDWVADSTKVSKLSSILGNEDAAKVIHSSFRHPLVDYFEKKNYLDNWVIYGVDSKERIKPLLINDFGNSTRDCNNNKQSELVAILKNKNNNSKKLIIISLYGSDNYDVIYDKEIDSDVSGFRKLSSSEKSQLNYDYDIWYTNPLMMVWNDYSTTVIGLNPYNNSVEFQQLYGYD